MLNGELHQEITRPSLESHIGSSWSELSHVETQMGLFSHFRETVQVFQMDISQVSLLDQLSELLKEQCANCLAIFSYLC